MAGKKKISDTQIIECVEAGMTYHEIAKKYGMNHQSVHQRIKKMREDGKIPYPETEGQDGATYSINKMDTVVRIEDRLWFRVTEVYENHAHLTQLLQGKPLGVKRIAIDVPLSVLAADYEKKDYPEVKCYNLNDIAPGVDPDNVECYETFEEPEVNIPEPEYNLEDEERPELGHELDDVAFLKESDNVTITMPRGVAESLADFIEWNVFDRIRNDTDIDNINWLCGICDAYKELRKQVG